MGVNDEIRTLFNQLGTGLELLGKGSFRSNAHKRVARQLADMPEDISAFIDRDPATAALRLEALPDIGKGAVRRILEWHESGKIEEVGLSRAKADTPRKSSWGRRFHWLMSRLATRTQPERASTTRPSSRDRLIGNSDWSATRPTGANQWPT